MTTGHTTSAHLVFGLNPVSDGIHDPELVRERILLLGSHISEYCDWNLEKNISIRISDGALRLCGYEIIDVLEHEYEIDVFADYRFTATFDEMQPYLVSLADGCTPKALSVSHLCGEETINRIKELFPSTKIYMSATLPGCARDIDTIASFIHTCHLDGIVCSNNDALSYRKRLPLPTDILVTEGYATRSVLAGGGDPEYFSGVFLSLVKEVSGIPIILLPDPEAFGPFVRAVLGKESDISAHLSTNV